MEKTMLMALAPGLSLPAIASEKIIDMYGSEHYGYYPLQGKMTEKDGSRVRIHVMNDQALSALKEKYSVPAGPRSCHTAVAGELVIEGHVPAAMIHQAMQSDSSIYGPATPSISTGSPGMKVGDREGVYDVIAFAPDESQNVFQRIEQMLITGRRHHPV